SSAQENGAKSFDRRSRKEPGPLSREQARMRMFAGPNGSGKTTVKNGLRRPPQWFGIYVNPDELEQSIRDHGELSLEPFAVTTTVEEVRHFFGSSAFLKQQNLHLATGAIECRGSVLDFRGLTFNSYYAS